MFVGHYAAALGARSFATQVPLWFLFFAVQFVDYLWAIFILLGIEEARVVPNFLEASHLDLYFMPYTHSLAATVVWSAALGIAYVLLARPERRMVAGGVVAFAVASHWFADLIVHIEDLPLLYGDPKVGFGLWRNQLLSQSLEAGILLLGLILYVRATKPKGAFGRATPIILAVVMFGMQAIGQVPPSADQTIQAFAQTALLAYTVLVGFAFLVDRTRESR
ncbi:MAG: hypothetical protein AAGH41_14875 [Pseudomonadota bacterium]